ncbi:MAG TPA: hypothetical protein VEU72_00435 [Nitrosopumilaceae archaeon]|nr:hypothetical protein [Nitrosopumilaceae archaeon]
MSFPTLEGQFLYENISVKHERKLGGLEESIGMLAALSDMVNDAKISSESTINEVLKKENHERFPLMYNLCVIKIGLEILRLKLNEIDNITSEQFFKIDTAISEMSDEILELRERQELLVN